MIINQLGAADVYKLFGGAEPNKGCVSGSIPMTFLGKGTSYQAILGFTRAPGENSCGDFSDIHISGLNIPATYWRIRVCVRIGVIHGDFEFFEVLYEFFVIAKWQAIGM